MREKIARGLLGFSAATIIASTFFLWRGLDPFRTFYFLFAWGSYIGVLDAWLYLQGGESLFIGDILEFITFLVPFSAFVWFLFEFFNLRLQNWIYLGVPSELALRWAGNFLAFGTVLPGIFLTANLLEHYGVFRKNEFSQFFSEELPPAAFFGSIAGGAAMLLLPLLWPRYFFPLIWGGFVLLLDPLNARWRGKSLIQEWRQRNWNRTLQLLLAGFLCGGLWEFWNFWAGAKWVYTIPLPDSLLRNIKVFEMPLLGFLGFPPFALECFVMAESARNLRDRIPRPAWRLLVLGAFLFSLWMCREIDLHTVQSFR